MQEDIDNPGTDQHAGLLASLRALIPTRTLQFSESLRIAELQANRLLELSDITEGPVPSEIVSELPHIRVACRDLPTSGLSYWDGQSWVICLNRAEPATRRRFTLLHEFKHVIDHGRTSQLYVGSYRRHADEQAEQAADYFAGCALMPKRIMKRAWGDGIQRSAVLAALLDVSPSAVDVRLAQLGLSEPRLRCAPASSVRVQPSQRDSYHRQKSGILRILDREEVAA